MAVAEQVASEPADCEPRPYVVVVEDLHVSFKVFSERDLGLGHMVTRGFQRRESTFVHAVRGASFRISEGEVVGIIGSNGSGKTTLLQSIGGLIPPSSGQVLVRSSPVLLGVGAVLKPQLTGRRNIVLGCLAMGMTSAEIEEEMPAIEKFCGLREAINRPMETYSSGMKARLAFAVATVRVPDILLIDEALAVGDRKFKKRSLRRIRLMQEQAKTIIMVTHNMNEVQTTCNRVIWMNDGAVVMDGAVEEVLEAYDEDGSDD